MMSSAETRYSTAVELLDELCEFVVASEGVKPYIGDHWLAGIDPEPRDDDGFWPYRLAIPEDTPEGSVILIKGRPGGGPEETYRLFQTVQEELRELAGKIRGNWTLYPATGQLIYDIGPGEVSPSDWGYCKIIENGWAWGEYEEALRKEAQATSIGTADLLNQLIRERQRAERAEATLDRFAYKLVSPDLLGVAPPRRGEIKGHLRALANSHEPHQHCAASVVHDLRQMYEDCREVRTDLPELGEGSLKA